MAMSLDEKGRACMKRKEYDLALVLLLEACHEYQQCRSELLERSDNYGLINLEIAWCYLQLGNVSQLPDAEIRLQECQRNFERIHGKNMERVLAVKGSNANEKTLYTRLNLMQGICAYHQGNKSKAELLLKHVQKEIKALEIPEDALEEVIALGYSDKEARIALRAMNNQVSDAVRFANKLREDRARVEEANRKRAKYGKVANGSWVNVGYVKTLVAMGYLEDHAVTALKQTNNEMSQSIDLITNSPDVVDAALQSSLMDESAADAATADLKNIASTSKDALRRSEKLQEAAKVVQANKRARKEATERFREELGDSLGSTDGYMALPLEEEARFLEKYLKFLEYNGTSSEQD